MMMPLAPTGESFTSKVDLALSVGDELTNATARAYQAFLFALEIRMCAREIVVELTWGRVDIDKRVAQLDRTKDGLAQVSAFSRGL